MTSGPRPPRKQTRPVRIGRLSIGAGHPVAVQSMTATRTTDIDATVKQVLDLEKAGADVVRIAVDSRADAAALAASRSGTRWGTWPRWRCSTTWRCVSG
jgi:(E)-4-hydroxy-3-methylbut-2-enyl-diphosphate synthase